MNAIFTGRKRRGKTTLAFARSLDYGGGIIVFDPKREFRNWPATISDVTEMEMAVDAGYRIVIFHPVGDVEVVFSELGQKILAMHTAAMNAQWDKQGKCFTLLVDEANQLQSPNRINDHLRYILSQCRPEILNVFQTMQSPADAYRVSKVCNSDYFLFQTTHVADIERVSQFAGARVAEILPTLDYHEYLHFCEDDSSYELVDNPKEWFVPLDYVDYEKKEGPDVPKKIEYDDFKKLVSQAVREVLKERGDKSSESDEEDDDAEDGFIIMPPKKKAS